MAKPILIVQVIGSMHYSTQMVEKIASEVKQKLEDEYHVLIVPSFGEPEVKFQVFYEKDFTEVNYEELKQIVIKSANNILSFDPQNNEMQEAYKKFNDELYSTFKDNNVPNGCLSQRSE